MRRLKASILICIGMSIAASCVTLIQSGSITEIRPETVSTRRRVESPMKAFMVDGSTVVYQQGALITPDSIEGDGVRYSAGLLDTARISEMTLDSVVGIEAFQGKVNAGASFIATIAGTALATIGTAALAVAIFGSCPTFYASPQQGGLLQAEAFSYSIAPLLEVRDLDALRIAPDSDGVVRLELRNEALETHYINQLQLVTVDHAADVRAIPDDGGAPIGVTDEVSPSQAVDRDGRDVLAPIIEEADSAFSSSIHRIESTSSAADRDYIDLTFDRPEGDEAVVVLRLRNSLLTTVLFYDMMLGRAGAGAVDWIGEDMARIGTVVELGQWFQDAMGLRVQVPDGDEWIEVGRVADTGPIAWEEVGIRVPVPKTGPVRVRLSFVTDAWRIDRVALGRPHELSRVTPLQPSRIIEDGGSAKPDALELVAEPDDRYLVTYPGTSAMLEFEPPATPDDLRRSYLLSSQGYYTEWIRSKWIRDAAGTTVFEPNDSTVATLMHLWLSKKDTFEKEFYASRIPVR